MASIGRLLQQGVQLHRQGRLAEASRLYEQVLARAPDNFDAAHLRGLAALQAGEAAAAEPLLRRAAAIKPDLAEAQANHGKALAMLGRAGEAAACGCRALTLDPFHAGAVTLLAALADDALKAGDLPVAQRAVDGIVQASPNHANRGLSYRLALAYQAERRFDEAAAALLAPVRRLHAPDGALPPPVPPFTTTSPAKLRHDIEQFRHLRARGVLDASCDAVIAAYEAVLAELSQPGEQPLSEAQRARLGPAYNRLLYLAPTPAMPEGALNPDLDGPALEAAFHRTPPGLVWFDDFLRPEALAPLRRFCLESTIFWQLAFTDEVGCGFLNGYACPLILQIAEELRDLVPGLLADQRLRILWAYKYYRSDSGLAMHADDGAVSLNFWLTPDEANLDPETGGLRFWDHTEAPVAYFDTGDYGEKLRILERTLAATPQARAHRLPYGCNRAALFNSKVLHQTDVMRFAEGYENRRINMTMIFGALRR